MAELIELAPGGFEQVDHPDGFVEFGLYGAPGELPAFPAGEAELAGVRVHVRGEEVADDWAERWREFHRPVLVGGRVWVRPPWSEPREGALDLVIDPAQAFGTGAHPTTRLSLELLLGLGRRGGGPLAETGDARAHRALADLGCGSGVLAIAAARLGFAPVTAFDNDRAARRGHPRERPGQRRRAGARRASRSARAGGAVGTHDGRQSGSPVAAAPGRAQPGPS